MTKATREGRRLRIEVDDGLDFLVDPIAATRGRFLTDLFILGALGSLTPAQAEAIFVEALGPANYARATGYLVDQFEDDQQGDDLGEYRCTWGPDGRLDPDEALDRGPIDAELAGLRFTCRRPPAGHTFDPLPMRQEEVEALALIAFYWQTVAGMEAVEAFIAEGEGMAGSVKAMTLLQFRLGHSPSRTSPRSESASPTQQGGSLSTDTPQAGGKLVRLPATPHSVEQQPADKKPTGSWFRRSGT